MVRTEAMFRGALFRSTLTEDQLMAVGVADDEITHAISMGRHPARDGGAARGEIVMQRIDAFTEDADNHRSGRRHVRVQVDGTIPEAEAHIARRIFPAKSHGEAEPVAIIGERRRHVLDVEDGGLAGDRIWRIGHDLPSPTRRPANYCAAVDCDDSIAG